MFDFFGDVINFFNVLAEILNFVFASLSAFLSALRGVRAVGQALETVARFPPEIATLLLFALAMMIFDYVRGRGK